MSVFGELPHLLPVSIKDAVAKAVPEAERAALESNLREGNLTEEQNRLLWTAVRRLMTAETIDRRPVTSIDGFEINPLNPDYLLASVVLGERDDFFLM